MLERGLNFVYRGEHLLLKTCTDEGVHDTQWEGSVRTSQEFYTRGSLEI